MSLGEYIASDLATTSGASTFGKVEWEFEGEKGKFKARKNFLLDITTVEYLEAETIRNLGKQVNKSFIKAELGKMRIAVTGDLWSYFSQSWLNYLCGGVYLKWPGNTLDEDVAVQTKRMAVMLEWIMSGYSLPFDFAGFDHQATTDEERIQVRDYLSRGMVNVPLGAQHFWRSVLEATVDSFSNATMLIRDNEKVIREPITGGVESGIRLTSLCGNYWNNTMTSISKDLCARCGLEDNLQSWLRGDDSAIVAHTYWGALAMRLAYAAINAVGNDSKYGILRANSEFLRIWYGEDRCYGYVNRSLPGVLQRKPWGGEPWDPEGVVRAQIEAINTCTRRTGRDNSDLIRMVSREWSMIRGKDTNWLALPIGLGGLGLLPFRGRIPDLNWPKLKHPTVKVTNLEPTSYERYARGKEEWAPTIEELKTIQETTISSKMASDDVRGLGHVFRDSYKKQVKEMGKEEWITYRPTAVPLVELQSIALKLSSIESVPSLAHTISDRPGDFGIAKPIERWWGQLKEMAAVRRDLNIMKELRGHDLRVWQAVKRWEKRGLHRADALDYVFGKIGGLMVGTLHPLLTAAIESTLAHAVRPWGKWKREAWGWFTGTFAWMMSAELASSALAKRLFRW
jgi:hypothetical protein